MIDINIIGLILAGLFSGFLLSGLLLLPTLLKNIATESLFYDLLPGFLRTAVILGITAGFGNALAAQSTAAFLLAIIAMSLILSRTHILRLVINSHAEGKDGDAGARRMYRIALGMLFFFYIAQFSASVVALYLLILN